MRALGKRSLALFAERRRLSTVLLALILALAAALPRLVYLDRFPPGLQGDEAWMGLEAQRIGEEGWIGTWTSAGWGQPTGAFYVPGLLFRWLPQNVLTLRASMAMLGILTVPALYLMARSLFGARPAAVAALLLTFSYWHWHYSRTAFSLISAPLVEILVLYLLFMGWRTRRGWVLLSSGVVFGLGLYTYRGYLFFVALIAVLWILRLVTLLRQPQRVRELLLQGVIFALPAFLLAIPMLLHAIDEPGDITGYGKMTAITNTDEYQNLDAIWEKAGFLAAQVGRSISIYFMGRRPDATDGLGSRPLLDPVSMVLFAVGVVACLRRWKDPRYLFIILGILVGMAAVAATVPWGENRRGISALPMVFIAAGIGGEVLFGLAAKSLNHWRTRMPDVVADAIWRPTILFILPVVLLGFVAFFNVRTYFGDIGDGEVARFAYAYELSRASSFLRSLRTEERPYVYFYSARWAYDYEARRFQAPGIPGEDRSREFGQFSLEREPSHGSVVYLLLAPYDNLMPTLQDRYPGGQRFELREGDRLIYAAYVLE